jgi:Domain of unknown function (DUF4148)
MADCCGSTECLGYQACNAAVSIGSAAGSQNGINASPRLPGDAVTASVVRLKPAFTSQQVSIMKTLIAAVLAVSVLAAPAVSFAQSTNDSITRAQVRTDLVQLEKAGYRPSINDLYYPADIRAAEARVHPQSGPTTDTNSYGSASLAGTSASGAPAGGVEGHSIYFGH